MQGRDSVEQTISSSSLDSEDAITTHADLQAPKFFVPEDLQDLSQNIDVVDALEHSQLENLQQLLEMAIQNEEKAKRDLTEITTKLEASESARKEIQLKLEKVKAHNNLTIQTQRTMIETLTHQRDTALCSIENLYKERDKAVLTLNEEKMLNGKLQLSLEETKRTFEQLKADYEKELFDHKSEIVKLKRVVFKQAKTLEENEKSYPPGIQFGRLFQETADRDMDMFTPANLLPGQMRRK